jgi:hypothetical protein
MLWHGDNSHGCLVLGRAWADTYLVDVIAAAITSGSPADSIFPWCCRICAILLKREEDLLEMGHDQTGQVGTKEDGSPVSN